MNTDTTCTATPNPGVASNESNSDPAVTELILININGQDRPGVTAALTEILARYNASSRLTTSE